MCSIGVVRYVQDAGFIPLGGLMDGLRSLIESRFWYAGGTRDSYRALNGGGEEPDKRLVAVDFGPEEATLGEAES